MSLVEKKIVYRGNLSAANPTDKFGYSLAGVVPPYIASLIVSAVGAGTSLVVKIQHSPDGGTTWFDLVTFAAKTGVGSELIAITGGVLPMLRVLPAHTGGTTTSTVEVAMHSGVK